MAIHEKAIVLSAAMALSSVSLVEAQTFSFSDVYVGGAFSAGTLEASSGGFNTVGAFTNADCSAPEGAPSTCSNRATVNSGSLVFGIDNLANVAQNTTLRVEGEASFYEDSSFVTGSFPGTSPFGFFYSTTVGDHRVGFVNAYLDYALDDRFTLFAGAGAGISSMTVATADGVVAAAPQTDTNFAFNFGVGVSYEVRPGMEMFTQLRHVDFGEADVNLTSGGPAGNYTLKLRSNEVRVGVRMTF